MYKHKTHTLIRRTVTPNKFKCHACDAQNARSMQVSAGDSTTMKFSNFREHLAQIVTKICLNVTLYRTLFFLARLQHNADARVSLREVFHLRIIANRCNGRRKNSTVSNVRFVRSSQHTPMRGTCEPRRCRRETWKIAELSWGCAEIRTAHTFAPKVISTHE